MPDDTPTPEDSTPDQPQNEGGSPVVEGNIIDIAIDRELADSYLTYAMSTIMDRALPDVRDGLKPSQRRILVAMNDLNLGPRSKHRKCAKIAGDTSGNYHPHGESVVYPTLVGMAQSWRMRHPLVDPQGNFGSIDGDPPAAMRYTEARLAAPAVELLDDLKLSTVDFQENYDATRDEPTVLPGKFPNLLVNGGIGIAVGMATSLPPHNVNEICDAIVAYLDNPDIGLAELMEIVPGPDFPTGGTICGRKGIVDGYSTGRGKITLRAKTHIEEQKNGKDLIVITEIPYQILKTTIIDQIVECVKNERISDIADVNDYSGRDGMRLVVECKKSGDAEVVRNQLFQYTGLQGTFSIMNIALVNRQPRTMGLKELIHYFVEHRKDVIRRRTQHLLREAQHKAHLREGLIYAVCDIDEVIKLIRGSKTRDEAIDKLMARGFQIPADHPYAPSIPQRLKDRAAESPDGEITLSRIQAEAIGRMQLIQLVGLEIEKLVSEYVALIEEIEGYELILAEESRVLDIIREDTLEMKDKYGEDRRTDIEGELADIDMADLIAEEDVVVTISHAGYVKRLPLTAYRTQGRGGRGVIGAETKDDDFTEYLFVASTHDDLLCFTNQGRVFKIRVFEIPEAGRTSRGRAIINILDLREGESVCAFLPIQDFEKFGDFLVFATADGLVKRTSLKLYQNVRRSGLIALNLREGDSLIGVRLTSGDDHIVLNTASGMAIRFDENDARAMGRTASGVKGINLGKNDQVVAMCRADDERQLLTVTENGYGKRTPMIEYLVQPEEGDPRPQGRGGKGRADIKTTKRNGQVVTSLCVAENDQVMLITEMGMIVRSRVGDIRQTGRNTAGVRVINLKDGDRLVAAALIADPEEHDDAPVAPPAADPDDAVNEPEEDES
jgi:DNA gyrase subunit A